MTRTALLPPPVAKEIRALWLPWLACVGVVVAPALVDSPWLVGGIAAPLYFIGAAALGALSIGHEYTGRTLSLLLSLPARRERLFLIKLGVLAVMLVTLSLAARTLVVHELRGHDSQRLATAVLPVLCGLFLAPWLTMVCRSPIAGAVFTVVIAGAVAAAGDSLSVAMYGRGPEMNAFRIAIAWSGVLALCAIGAVAGWRTFMRLEAIDGAGQEVRLPRWLRWRAAASTDAPLTKRHPVWLLVKKELRLQQMTFVVAGIYVLGWLAVASLRSVLPDLDDAFVALTICYVGLLGLLIGSFASAGERQIGTLEWQVLLPMAVSKQWAVKVGVVLGLAMVLALGLPAALAAVVPDMNPKRMVLLDLAGVLFLLTAGSLYVSSLCTSGLWALMMSLPVTAGAVTFIATAGDWIGDASYRASLRMFVWMAPSGFGLGREGLNRLGSVLTVLLVAGFIALVLRFAFANHRSADRAAGRVWQQAFLMAAFATAGIMIFTGTQAFHR